MTESERTIWTALISVLIILIILIIEFNYDVHTRAVKVESRLETPQGVTWYLQNGDSLDFSYAHPGEMTLMVYYYGRLSNNLYKYEEHPAMKYQQVFN